MSTTAVPHRNLAAYRSAILSNILLASVILAPSGGASAATVGSPSAAERDGAHDFDFNLGVWRTEITRRLHPFDDASEVLKLSGTVTVRKVWDGKAQLEEIEADGARGHWEGMSLFLYDPAARQWSQTFAGSAGGVLTAPFVGSFKAGRGELYQQDALDGRKVLVRAVWSDITPSSHHYEEDYSADGGRTWKVSFTALKTKLS